MFQRTLTKFGSDGGHVDLVLEGDHYQLGDLVTGEIHVYGGSNPCKVRSIDVFFMMKVLVQEEQKERAIMVIPCESSFWIYPDERKVFPFTFQLPHDLLVSSETVSYYFMTELELADRTRYKDRDEITIHAPEWVQLLLQAFQQLGFQEHSHSRQFNGYEQEFLLFPSILFRDQIREVRLTVALEEDGLQTSLILELYEHTEPVTGTVWIDGNLLERMNYHHELERHFLRWIVREDILRDDHLAPVNEEPVIKPISEVPVNEVILKPSDVKVDTNPKIAPYSFYESISLNDEEKSVLSNADGDSESSHPNPRKAKPDSIHSNDSSTSFEEVQKVVVKEGKRLVGAIGALAAELFNGAVDLLEEHKEKRGLSSIETQSDSSPQIQTLHPNGRIKKVDFLDEQNKGFSIIYMEDDDD